MHSNAYTKKARTAGKRNMTSNTVVPFNCFQPFLKLKVQSLIGRFPIKSRT